MKIGRAIAAVLDRAVGIVSPQRELERASARAQADAIRALAGSYEAARQTRLNRGWIPTLGSADTDTLYDLDKLRAESRDLLRNDGYAQVLTAIVDHVVGCGLLPHAKVPPGRLGITDEQAKAYQDAADAVFYLWAPGADATMLLDFAGMTELVYRSNGEDGESFIRRRPLTQQQMMAREAPYSLAFEMIDPDRVCSPSRQVIEHLPTGHSIRHGIEYDGDGVRVRYWVLKRHPAELRGVYQADAFILVSAADMMHVFRPLRVGQTRGVPYLAPELDTFRMLDRVFEAELVTALVVACHSIFVRKVNPLDDAEGSSELTPAGDRLEQLEPGRITRLGPGEDVVAFNPTRPGGTFPPFVEILLRKMATGLNVPYEFLAKDFTKTNFSGGRQAALLAQRFFDREQKRLVRQWCRPARAMLLREAELRGELPTVGELTPVRRAYYHAATWSGPGYSYIDPQVEIGSSKDAVSAGLSTLADECGRTGKNWMEVLDQLAEERAYAEAKGLDISVFRPEPGSPTPSTSDREPGESVRDRTQRTAPTPNRRAA